jgi:hypothetical protein
MPAPRPRRLVAAFAAVAVTLAVVVAGVEADGSGTSRPRAAGDAATRPPASSPSTAAAVPSSADIAAARACEVFTLYLSDADRGSVPKAVGTALVQSASALLSGAQTDQAAGRSLPKWSSLGSELIAAAQDVVGHDGTALRSDGAAAAAECRSVPAAAARAGGFVRSG